MQETGPQNLRNFIVLCLVGSTNLHIDIVTMATSLINHFCDVCEEEVEKLITVNLLFLVPTLLAGGFLI